MSKRKKEKIWSIINSIPNGRYLSSIDRKFPKTYRKILKLKKNGFKNEYQCLYAYLSDVKELPICLECKGKVKFYNIRTGFAKFCSYKCSKPSIHTQKVREQTCLERYGNKNPYGSKIIQKKIKQIHLEKLGVDNPGQSEKIKKKIRKTNLERYGTEHPAQNKNIKKKIRKTIKTRYGSEEEFWRRRNKKSIKTNQKKYGVDNVFANEKIKGRIRKTNLKRYGVEYPPQNEKVKRKIAKTNLRRYGVENPMHSSIIIRKLQKTLYGVKTIKRQGKTFKVQGYEPLAIDYFINLGVPVKHILYKKVPSFKYKYEGKEHTYHPDLKIKYPIRNGTKDWIIEVKSTYTIGINNKKYWLLCKEKAKAVMKRGYNFAFIIFDGNGEYVIRNPKKLTWKKLVKTFL